MSDIPIIYKKTKMTESSAPVAKPNTKDAKNEDTIAFLVREITDLKDRLVKAERRISTMNNIINHLKNNLRNKMDKR